jgi:solute carrier family 41
MKRIDELVILIPVILNLKGNLEMNLSARLGTAANTGALEADGAKREIVLGNLVLLQVQATVVSFVAACFAFLVGLAVPDPPAPSESSSVVGEIGVSILSHFGRKPIYPHPIPKKESAPSGLSESVVEFVFIRQS